MIATNEDALICDLAETYNVFNYKELPVSFVATLASGLKANSRINLILNEMEMPTEALFLATIIDQLNLLIWMQTKDGQKGRNKPKSILEQKKDTKDVVAFKTAEEFEEAKQKIINSEKGG